MSNRNLALRAAITTALALGSTTMTVNALAADDDKEQCAGVIKAGKNDCATTTNACHSHVTVNNSPEAWIYLPKGTCERIAGAHIVMVKDPSPKK